MPIPEVAAAPAAVDTTAPPADRGCATGQVQAQEGGGREKGPDGRPAGLEGSVSLEEFVAETTAVYRCLDDGIDLQPENLEVVEELGRGLVGVVEKVLHRPTQKVMARKRIHLELKPRIRKQICNELKVLRDQSLPHVVGFYGSLFTGSDLFLFMEYMDAGSLDTIYRRAGPIPDAVLCKVTWAILQQLQALQDEHKVLYRDIKPTNILMNTAGEVKLCDFGVSRELVNSLANSFVGTRSYMAPERLCGSTYTVKSDVWSLGLSVLEMAIGQFPIPQNSKGGAPLAIFDLLDYIVNGPALTASEVLSEGLRGFIDKCLTREADQRPDIATLLSGPWVQQAESLSVDLAQWVRSTMPQPGPE